jgi:putative modified peptide
VSVSNRRGGGRAVRHHMNPRVSRSPHDPKQLDALLDRLSSDDDFRERFLGNPTDALSEFGIAADPAKIPPIRRLPSKQQLRNDHDAVRERLADSPDFVFILITGAGA